MATNLERDLRQLLQVSSLRDSGLCAFLVGVREKQDLAASPLAGFPGETLVFGEIRRLQVNAAEGWNLHFWRDRSRKADFLWHRAGRFELAEAKWTELPATEDLAALRRVAAELPRGSVDGLSIVCRAAHGFPLPPDGHALPLHELPDRWAR